MLQHLHVANECAWQHWHATVSAGNMRRIEAVAVNNNSKARTALPIEQASSANMRRERTRSRHVCVSVWMCARALLRC